MFTRVHFCEDCAKNQRPQSGQFFVVHGGHSDQNWLFRLDNNVHARNYGFTPHLFTVISNINDVVTLEIICGIVGCGVKTYTNSHQEYEIIVLKRKTIEIPIKDFKALYEFKDSGYKL